MATPSQHSSSSLPETAPDMSSALTDLEKGGPELHRKEDILNDSPEVNSNSNVVDWDGLDDPQNPVNWSLKKKWANVLMVAAFTLLTPFASSMFAPTMKTVMVEFGFTSQDLASFSVSIYLLGYAFGPLFIAPLSEIYGRLPLYHTCSALFILMNLGCAKSTNLGMLIAFRFLTGLCGACPLTLGPATISDCFKQEERGRVTAMWTLPVLLGPSIGPVAGGYLADALGWRWDFWFLMIAGGVVYVPCLLLQRETYPPVLLERKARRLRNETGNMDIVSPLRTGQKPRELLMLSIRRPLKLLCFSPIVLGLSILTATAYGILYLLFTTISPVFAERYGFGKNVGLSYLGFGLGQFIGILLFSHLSDYIVKRMAKGMEMKPEYRLPLLAPGAAMIPAGLLVYGWSANYYVHWIVPLIGTVFIGYGMITVFTPVTTYLIDAYTPYAASATAANTVLRSLGGAILPLAGQRMIDTLGIGWANTLLAGVSLALMPMIWVAGKYGETLRTHPRFRVTL